MIRSALRWLLPLLLVAAFIVSGCSSKSSGYGNNDNNGGGSNNTTSFDKVIAGSGTASITFNNAGTIGYHCKFHPNMTGTITVTSGGSPVTKNVSIVSMTTGFSPSSVSVPVGSTVIWTNNDTITHSVTSN